MSQIKSLNFCFIPVSADRITTKPPKSQFLYEPAYPQPRFHALKGIRVHFAIHSARRVH